MDFRMDRKRRPGMDFDGFAHLRTMLPYTLSSELSPKWASADEMGDPRKTLPPHCKQATYLCEYALSWVRGRHGDTCPEIPAGGLELILYTFYGNLLLEALIQGVPRLPASRHANPLTTAILVFTPHEIAYELLRTLTRKEGGDATPWDQEIPW
jgi:hypothetical protein